MVFSVDKGEEAVKGVFGEQSLEDAKGDEAGAHGEEPGFPGRTAPDSPTDRLPPNAGSEPAHAYSVEKQVLL